MEVSWNGDTPKWMIWGYPHFRKPPCGYPKPLVSHWYKKSRMILGYFLGNHHTSRMITIHELWCLTSFDHSPFGFLFRFFSAIVKDESDLVRFFFCLWGSYAWVSRFPWQSAGFQGGERMRCPFGVLQHRSAEWLATGVWRTRVHEWNGKSWSGSAYLNSFVQLLVCLPMNMAMKLLKPERRHADQIDWMKDKQLGLCQRICGHTLIGPKSWWASNTYLSFCDQILGMLRAIGFLLMVK
jgi:hypothetical protein